MFMNKIEKVEFLLGLQSIIRFERFIKDRVLLRGATSRTIKLRTIECPQAERRIQLPIEFIYIIPLLLVSIP